MTWRKSMEVSHERLIFEVVDFGYHQEVAEMVDLAAVQSIKFEGLARIASFEAPRCIVSIVWFLAASPCLWGKLQKPLALQRFKTGPTSRFAWLAGLS